MITQEQYTMMSELEKKVASWLSRNKISFDAQVPMFGASGELGSATVDFILRERNLIMRCMGSYWHSGAEAKARDLFGREQLVNKGYIVVDLQEEDLADDKITHTLRLALEGQEILK